MPREMYELDRDIALHASSETRFEVNVSDGWGIYGNPNGGYLAALMGNALKHTLPHPDPFTFTAHYVALATPGPGTIEVEIVRRGRGHSTGVARLVQGGKERVRAIATYGDLGNLDGPTREVIEEPPIPPREACETRIGPPDGSTFADRVDGRYVPGTTGFLDGVIGGAMNIGGYLRLRDEREPDPIALLLFADAMPPPALNAIPRVYIPTLELTVHVRRRPRPGWLRVWFTTRHMIGGYLEEDGRIWDAEGNLVALSRQLARVQR
jgi:hypothetical protein